MHPQYHRASDQYHGSEQYPGSSTQSSGGSNAKNGPIPPTYVTSHPPYPGLDINQMYYGAAHQDSSQTVNAEQNRQAHGTTDRTIDHQASRMSDDHVHRMTGDETDRTSNQTVDQSRRTSDGPQPKSKKARADVENTPRVLSGEKVRVRYFERPQKHWDGQRFNMSKHRLLYEKIKAEFTREENNLVEFFEPVQCEMMSVEAKSESIVLSSESVSKGSNGELQLPSDLPDELLPFTKFPGMAEEMKAFSGAAKNNSQTCPAPKNNVVNKKGEKLTSDIRVIARRNLDRVQPKFMLDAIERAHTSEFLTRITGRYFQDPDLAIPEFEVPCDENVFCVEIRDIAGTLQAAEDAIQGPHKFGFNIGGGSHHTCPGWGAGYCVLNDIAVSLIELKFVKKLIDRVIIIDLDVHQGDGNSLFFPPYYQLAGLPLAEHYEWCWHYNRWKRKEWYSYSSGKSKISFDSEKDRTDMPENDHPILAESRHEWVTSVSLHEQDNFPWMKYPSSFDVGLSSEMHDEAYLLHLHNALKWTDYNEKMRREERELLAKKANSLNDAKKGESKTADDRVLVIYVAGADPYEHDTLGGLNITKDGLYQRDAMVFDWCKKRNLPVTVVLAGGYAEVEDVADIHFNTFKAAMDVFEIGD